MIFNNWFAFFVLLRRYIHRRVLIFSYNFMRRFSRHLICPELYEHRIILLLLYRRLIRSLNWKRFNLVWVYSHYFLCFRNFLDFLILQVKHLGREHFMALLITGNRILILVLNINLRRVLLSLFGRIKDLLDMDLLQLFWIPFLFTAFGGFAR